MHIPGKSVPPHVTYLIVVFSSMLASSLAASVSSEDRKWLLDALLSLRHELRHNAVPTYMPPPSQWGARGPAPIPTPTHWIPPDNYAYQPNSLALPTDESIIFDRKRNYQFSFGLLCCNHPPTRPPKGKRLNSKDSRWRRLVQLMNSFNDRAVDTEPERAADNDRAENLDHPYPSYYDDERESSPEVQRRGVTVVKSGVSGINTG